MVISGSRWWSVVVSSNGSDGSTLQGVLHTSMSRKERRKEGRGTVSVSVLSRLHVHLQALCVLVAPQVGLFCRRSNHHDGLL